jgi:hypothetical protein
MFTDRLSGVGQRASRYTAPHCFTVSRHRLEQPRQQKILYRPPRKERKSPAGRGRTRADVLYQRVIHFVLES